MFLQFLLLEPGYEATGDVMVSVTHYRNEAERCRELAAHSPDPDMAKRWRSLAADYEKLAAAYPFERQSIMAQLTAARICLTRLSRPQDALRLYEGASASPVPHLDLEQDIESGIRETRNVLAQAEAFSAGASSGK